MKNIRLYLIKRHHEETRRKTTSIDTKELVSDSAGQEAIKKQGRFWLYT